MLAALLTAPNELQAQDVPTPAPGPGQLLVKVGANTVCGTDLRILRGEKTSGVELPVVLGHETAGHVAELGPGVTGFEAGAPVAVAPCIPCHRCWECRHDLENMCRDMRILGYGLGGGMAEYMLIPAAAVEAGCVFLAHEDLPSEQLALAEPLACVVRGQRWTKVEVDDTVLIMGAGPIGLLHLQLALFSGARAAIVSEPTARRRAHAERLGATMAVDASREDLAAVVAEATHGSGVGLTIICTGIPELVGEAVRLSRPGGRVNVFAGLKGKGLAEVEANLLHYRQVVLTGTPNSRRSDYETALHLIESGKIETASMVTHRFPLPSVHDALETVTAGDAIKVAVMP